MRRAHALPALLAIPLLALGASATVRPTDATWLDEEWVTAEASTIDCEAPGGLVAGSARGRVFSGSLLGLDLDTVAALDGVTATTDGTTASASPAAASPVAGLDDAWADPLDLALVAGILGLSTAGITLPVDTPVGVVGQFAQAHGAGDFVGAAGAVNDSGLLELTPDQGGYPDLATLELKQLVGSVNTGLATLLDQVAGLRLEVGAVASRAGVLDACDVLFAGGTPVREYLSAGLDLEIESPLVSALVTDVTTLLDGVETLVNGLASDGALIAELVGGVSDIAGGLLGALGLGNVTVALTASIDLDAVRDLLVEPVSDPGGVLVVRPGDGTITINLAALLAETYPGQFSDGLNGLDPNSSLLGDPAILTTLVNALGRTLTAWTTGVQGALDEALDLLHVNLTAELVVGVLIPVARVSAEVDGTLGDLLAGEVVAAANAQLLGIDASLLNPLLAGLQSGLGLLVGNAVAGALEGISPVVDVVASTVTAITALVSDLYDALFLDGVVEVTMNAQNQPLAGDPAPEEWAGIPEGQLDVAAIRVGVLDALGALGVYVHLARSSVGPLCYATELC